MEIFKEGVWLVVFDYFNVFVWFEVVEDYVGGDGDCLVFLVFFGFCCVVVGVVFFDIYC